VAALVADTCPDATPLERALIALARKTWAAPARLVPSDLEPVRALAGDAALDYALVMGGFHFINRVADLLHVEPEALPEGLRRFEPLRQLSVRIAARMMARAVDLTNRPDTLTWDEAVRGIVPRLGGDGARAAAALAPLRARPRLVEVLHLALDERDERSTLDRATIGRVQRGVEAALPHDEEQATGFHPRPGDPVDAFVFVGTRYAHRTSPEMVAALRAAGFDDLGILDLATAVADANQWARLHRLLGLPADVLSL
jgi:alkylhydroperoxidase family enzyme